MPARPNSPARSVPVCANGAPLGVQHGWTKEKAKEVNELVRWALTERSRAICRGWSKVDPQLVKQLMVPLQRFVTSYPCPQAETIRGFWLQYESAVRQVMPFSPAGRTKLERLTELVATI